MNALAGSTKTRKVLRCVLFCAAVTTALPALAQPPGFGGFRGPGGPGGDRDVDRGRERGPMDYAAPEERARRFEGFIQRLDENEDGTISPEEIEGSRMGRFLVMRLEQEIDIDASEGFRISEVRDRLVKHYQSQASQASEDGSERDSSSDSESDGESSRKVPGFDVQVERPPVPGFGSDANPGYTIGGPVFPQATTASGGSGDTSSSSSSDSSRSSSDSGDREAPAELDERVKRYAEGLMRRYDENEDGKLTEDEWSEMGGNPEQADRDNDRVVTLEELTVHLMNYSRGSTSNDSGSSRSSGSSAGGPRRYSTSSSHLPEGLPDWFRDRDKNADGQIMMNEYSDVWTDEKAQEFLRYDLNGDGVITPQECLKAGA